MKIREYEKGDIYKVFLNPIDQYNMQYIREDVLMENIAFTGLDNKNNIVGCGGLTELWNGVYEAWVALDERYKTKHVSLLKILKNSLDNMPVGVVRVHAHMNVQTQNYKHLMEFLGFEEEARLKNYFPMERDCVVFRRLYKCHN